MIYDCVVIGGGAAGLYCACRIVSQKQLSVAVVDSNSIPGKKLLMTGSGRCNLTNSSISVNDYHCDQPSKLEGILKMHSYRDTVDFFRNELGLKCLSKDNLFYPVTLRASTVADSLTMYLKDHNVDFYFDTKVTNVSCDGDDYIINSQIKGKSIVFACGGVSYPKTGSDGSYLGILARYLDKSSVAPLLPSLVPLKTFEKDVFALKGMRFKCDVKLYKGNDCSEELTSSSGELLFTDYGVSGICILDVSGFAVRAIADGNKPVIRLDFLNAESISLDDLKQNLNMHPNRSVVSALSGLVQEELMLVVLMRLGIPKDAKPKDISDSDVDKLYECLSCFELSIKGSQGFENAQITTGGIKLGALGDHLEISGLNNAFICGESLDCDGICGGYNLQFAWSSADLAAKGVLECLN